jgi:hypothetical protein
MLQPAADRSADPLVEVLANLADSGALDDPHARREIGYRFKATVDVAKALGDDLACLVVQSIAPRPFPAS